MTRSQLLRQAEALAAQTKGPMHAVWLGVRDGLKAEGVYYSGSDVAAYIQGLRFGTELRDYTDKER